METGTVIVHLIHPDAVSRRDADGYLTDEDKLRAMSFRDPEHGFRWMTWRASLRRILGDAIGVQPRDVPVVFNDFGKPLLAAPFDCLYFSLSHCDDLALLALCPDGPVGIDLEPLDRAGQLSGCETTFCHQDEIDGLPADEAEACSRLLEIWTAKEAVLKAVGTGFSHPPETMRLHKDAGRWVATSAKLLPHLSDQVVTRLDHPALTGYCASISSPTRVGRIAFA